jgi:hypothetical protein
MAAHVTSVQHHELIGTTQVPPNDSIQHTSLATDTGTLLIQGAWAYQFKLAHVNSEVLCQTACKGIHISCAVALAGTREARACAIDVV